MSTGFRFNQKMKSLIYEFKLPVEPESTQELEPLDLRLREGEDLDHLFLPRDFSLIHRPKYMRRGKYWAVIRGITRHVEQSLPLPR
jgi:hypothetical protein